MSTNITIIGNVTKEPELRFTPSGAAVANFTVAVNERRKNAAGEWEDGDATFYECAAWKEMAENVAESIERGSRVVLSGKLKARNYDRQDGSRGTSLDVTVDEIGPSLRWATAKVTRSGGNGGGNRGNGGGNAGAAPAANNSGGDPWGGAAQSGGDEPPF